MTIPDPLDALPARPVVIDLGPQKRRRIKRLERSSGRLARALAALAGRISDEARPDDPRDVIPVILLYECIEEDQIAQIEDAAEPVSLIAPPRADGAGGPA